MHLPGRRALERRRTVHGADVAFTYKLVIDQGISTYAQYFTEGTTFETPDDTTLIWKSPTPTNQPLTPPWIYILPEHVWSQYADLDKAELRAVENVPSVTTGRSHSPRSTGDRTGR